MPYLHTLPEAEVAKPGGAHRSTEIINKFLGSLFKHLLIFLIKLIKVLACLILIFKRLFLINYIKNI